MKETQDLSKEEQLRKAMDNLLKNFTKKRLYSVLDEIYEATKFTKVSVENDYSGYYHSGSTNYFFVFLKNNAEGGYEIVWDRLYFYTYYPYSNRHINARILKGSSWTPYKRTRMLVDWVKDRGVPVDVSGVPIGEEPCLLCKKSTEVYPDKPHICKDCMRIYELGKKEKSRLDSLEKFSREPHGGWISLNDLPYELFVLFLNRYLPDGMGKEGINDAIWKLKEGCELVNRHFFMKGVEEGKNLLKGLADGSFSLRDEADAGEKIKKARNSLCEWLKENAEWMIYECGH